MPVALIVTSKSRCVALVVVTLTGGELDGPDAPPAGLDAAGAAGAGDDVSVLPEQAERARNERQSGSACKV